MSSNLLSEVYECLEEKKPRSAISAVGMIDNLSLISSPPLRILQLSLSLFNSPTPNQVKTMASTPSFRRILSLPAATTTITTRLSTRTFTTTPLIRKPSDDKSPLPFGNVPSPPRLPKEEQEIFESLQKQSTGAFSTPKINQSPDSEPEIKVNGNGEELHPDAVVGLRPDFEGERNPKTGEVGGPKNEPLRWGAKGDWSYSGRVTDF